MRKIIENSNAEVWLSVLVKPFEFNSPFNNKEFVVLLYVVNAEITQDEQNKISQDLFLSGCRYAVCAGYECST